MFQIQIRLRNIIYSNAREYSKLNLKLNNNYKVNNNQLKCNLSIKLLTFVKQLNNIFIDYL